MTYYLLLAQVHVLESLKALTLFAAPGASCGNGTFFGFPTWYKYLQGERSVINSPVDGQKITVCTPYIGELKDFWLIGLAVIEILLRIAMLAAVAFVFYAGVKYTNSRGNADKIETAKKTLVDAIAGFVITIIATAAVAFIAKSFS